MGKLFLPVFRLILVSPMEYLCSAIIANKAPNMQVDNASISKLIEAAGDKADAAKVELLIKSMQGKTVEEHIESGKAKMSSIAVAAAPVAAGATSSADAGKAAEKVEEAEPEPSEDASEFDMDF